MAGLGRGLGVIIWICTLTFLSNTDPACGKYLEGHLKTAEKWHFLTRFCFLSSDGGIKFEFRYPVSRRIQKILLYYDEPHQWAAVYKNNSKNCWQKLAVLRPENNQVIELTERSSPCTVDTSTGVAYYSCQDGRTFRSARQRWWFLVVANCESTSGLDLQYKLRMTNSESGNPFAKEFSADEFHVLETDMAFLFATFIITLLSIYVAVRLRLRQLLHTTYKMYMASLILGFVNLFVMCVANGKYAADGKDIRWLVIIARLFESAALLVFLLMLILVAKGYTITRGRISQAGAIKIAVFMTLYFFTYCALFFYEAFFFDPGLVLYLYESPPGYGLIGLRILGWVWFCYAIFFTLKHYPEKSKFYYPLFIIYTLWFWGGPISVFVTMKLAPLWVRAWVVNIVWRVSQFFAYIVFLVLTRPSAANSNFPYHVRTSQIGVMTGSGGAATNGVPYTANQELDSFSPYAYAPDPPPSYRAVTENGQTQLNDLFMTSNTRTDDKEKKQNKVSVKKVLKKNFSVTELPK